MMTPWTGLFGLLLKAQVIRSPAQVEYRKAILPSRPYYKPSALQRMPTGLAAIIRWSQVMVQA
jgi:hypothetical protein